MKDGVKKEDTSLAFSLNASPAFSDPSVAATLLGLLLRGGLPCLAAFSVPTSFKVYQDSSASSAPSLDFFLTVYHASPAISAE